MESSSLERAIEHLETFAFEMGDIKISRSIVRALDEIADLKARLAAMDAALELAAVDKLYFSRRDDGAVVPIISCSDVFAFACADGEEIEWKDIPALLEKVKAEGWPAAVKWVSEKRGGLKPMKSAQEDMTRYEALQARLAQSEAAAGEMRAIIQRVKENGFDSLWIGDNRAGQSVKLLWSDIEKALSSDAGKKALDVIEALEFYAKPRTYGQIIEDVNEVDGVSMPGRRAREALDRFHGRKMERG